MKLLMFLLMALMMVGCHHNSNKIPAYMEATITNYFISRGGDVKKSRIYYDSDGILTMTDGVTTVECYSDGHCRECGDK